QGPGGPEPGDPGQLEPLSPAPGPRAARPPGADDRPGHAGRRQAALRRRHAARYLPADRAAADAGRCDPGNLRAGRATEDGGFRRAGPQRAGKGAPGEDGGGTLVTLALYGHRFSSYSWKALIALYAKGIPFEFREVGPEHPEHEAFVQAVHPQGKFPVLLDGEAAIFEATSIIEHLALHQPGSPPLIPADPAAAAQMRMLDRVFDNYVMNVM